MPDRLTGIEVFVHALRRGGLSAAARELGMSPAMAAKHLDALERRLGVTLVRRTTRKLSPTEAGRHFSVEAERLLTELSEAEAAASANTSTIAGLLRVNVPVTFGVLRIAPLVPSFSHDHPRVTLELGLNDRYVDLVGDDWDIGIRIGRLPQANLISRKVAQVSSVVCASPDYVAACGMPKSLADLQHHACLGYTLSNNAGAVNAWRFGADGGIVVRVAGPFHANNGEALIAAARLGQGLVYGPRFIAAAALQIGELIEVSLDAPLYEIGAVYILSHPDRRPAATGRAWTAHLAAHFRRHPV